MSFKLFQLIVCNRDTWEVQIGNFTVVFHHFDVNSGIARYSHKMIFDATLGKQITESLLVAST